MEYGAYPGALDVELSSACNLKCPMCPRSQPGFKENRGQIGHMSDRIFGRLHRELRDRRGEVNWIWLHVGGESLLDPRFIERANLLAGTGAYTAVSTNAVPLTPDLIDRIMGSRLGRLMVSLDGATKETYEAVRVGAVYEETMAKVDLLLSVARDRESRNQDHPDIWLQCLQMDDTAADMFAFAERWGEGEVTKYQRLRGIKKGKVFLKRHETLAAQVEPRGYGWDEASGGSKGRRFNCRKPFGRATILSDGGASICCYDIQGRCIVGSLETNSLNGVWHSEPFQRLRRGFDEAQAQHKKGVRVDNDLFPELCRKC